MEIIQGELKLDPNWKIGVVTSRFNWEITGPLEDGAMHFLKELGLTDDHLVQVRVPGAVEIPLAVQKLFEAGCDGVIALGAVIRGETSHYDYVCNAVERGVNSVSLAVQKPVAFGVLTTEDEEQARERIGGRHGHKGREAAEVVVEMLSLLRRLER